MLVARTMAAIVIAIAIGSDDDDETDDKTFAQLLLLPFEILIYWSVHRKESRLDSAETEKRGEQEAKERNRTAENYVML